MGTYRVHGTITVSTFTDVEADTEEEAVELASGRPVMDLPFQNKYDSESYWVVEELDGEVEPDYTEDRT